MKTVLQEINEWTTENAFNVEAQDGEEYVVVDIGEMRKEFDEWVKKEKPTEKPNQLRRALIELHEHKIDIDVAYVKINTLLQYAKDEMQANLTVEALQMVMGAVGLPIEKDFADNLIDVVEVIQEHGCNLTIGNIQAVKDTWRS